MLMLKIFAVSTLASLGSVLVAQAAVPSAPGSPSTGLLALVGAITLIGTSCLGVYQRYREVRSRADAHDLRNDLAVALAENARLIREKNEWKALYEAATGQSSHPRGEPK